MTLFFIRFTEEFLACVQDVLLVLCVVLVFAWVVLVIKERLVVIVEVVEVHYVLKQVYRLKGFTCHFSSRGMLGGSRRGFRGSTCN